MGDVSEPLDDGGSSAKISWTAFDAGLALDCTNDDKRWKILHAQYTLVVIHRGSAEWKYRRRDVPVAPGSVFVCEPGEVHETLRTDCPGDFTAFFVDLGAIRAVSESGGLAHLPHFVATGVPRPDLWQAFAALRGSFDDFDPESFSQKFARLLTQIVYETQPSARPGRISRKVLKRTWDQLHDEFRAHPTRCVKIRDVAEAQEVSYYTLVREFSKHFGIAPYEMVKGLRAQYAMDQLRRGPHEDCTSLTSLAVKCGYSDHAHLTRSFRQQWGATPSAVARSFNPKWLQRASRKSSST